MARPMSKSFYEWCIENNHEDWLELWDYKMNNLSPREVACGTQKKYWFKCSQGIHESEPKSIGNLTNKYRANILSCNRCNSVGQYLINNYGENALELYWDYEKNKVNPFDITRNSNMEIWIKCQEKDYHGSYKIKCTYLCNGQRCPYCASRKVHPKDSFGQYLIDTYGENALEKYWDFEKNKINPFNLSRSCDKKVWIKCLNVGYHDSYEIKCHNFYNGYRCSYCNRNGGKVHPKDSFAQYHIENTDPNFIEKYWSTKNKNNPFEIAPYSHKRVWIKCQNNKKHKDYEVQCYDFTGGCRCGRCKESYGEREIAGWLDNKNIKYVREKTFNDLLGLGNEPLRFDFYLLDYNVLIEYQGEQHYEPQDFFGGEEKFIEQQEHDKRKREYAKLHNIKLLEISYKNFDNIIEILNKELGLS